MNPRNGPALGTRVLAWSILVVAVFAAFRPAFSNGFLWWDDAEYITENPAVRAGFSSGSFTHAFTSGDAANWHPTTWLAHMGIVQVFGLEPSAHHAVSIVLHALSALLLGTLVARWTRRFALGWFVAALFALHPLRVESVAWAAELKDVLSVLFFLLALHAWTRHVERPRAATYLATIALVVLGLLAKPMLVSAPLLLLVLDAWPFGRARGTASVGARPRGLAGLVLEKAPFAVLAAASCVVTVIVQRAGGAMHPAGGGAPFFDRVGNAFAALARYVGKAFVPMELSPHYVWREPWTTAPFVAGLAGSCVVLALAWRWRRSRPWFGAGVAWFVIALVPVLQLVQVGDASMADRYSYLPSIGLALVVVLGVDELAGRMHARRGAALLGAFVLVALGVATWKQTRLWHDDVALFTRAIELEPDNPVAHKVLGKGLASEKRYDEAVVHLRRATELEPHYAEAWWNLGAALGASGRPAEAALALEEAARLAPDVVDVHVNLGLAYSATRRTDEAVACFERALELEPANFVAHGNLGLLLRARGRFDAALAHFQAALAARPSDAGARRWVAVTLLDAGRVREALEGHADVLRARAEDRERARAAARTAIDAARAAGREDEARALERLVATL